MKKPILFAVVEVGLDTDKIDAFGPLGSTAACALVDILTEQHRCWAEVNNDGVKTHTYRTIHLGSVADTVWPENRERFRKALRGSKS